ncbi:MAG: NAD(P)/FAD-dependent oxidoreductase [Cytophagales bacterium]|nr:MAG: NAD(P)/FAD-dependent oxidoreductase [Cytophagales bacterium]
MLEFDKLSLNVPPTTKKRVIIIGGGFGGINVALNLDSRDFQVVMFDKQNYHAFWPLLYQVATAGLEPDSIAEPLRKLFDDKDDFHFRLVRVTGVDPVEKSVQTLIGDLHYDYLVVATGSKSNFFGNAQVQKYAFPLKQMTDALNLRSQLLQCFEQASITRDLDVQQSLLNFVVVGGGPTGVEMAGSIAEMRTHVLPNDYPGLDFSRMHIYLVEGLDRVLPPMDPESSERAHKYLTELGVEIRLKTLVDTYDGQTVVLKNGEQLKSQTLIWAAGVTGSLIDGIPAESIERGRVLVDEFNQIKGLSNVFAIGDLAYMKGGDPEFPNGHPGVAQPAIQQGQRLAKNLGQLMRNREMEPFRYFNKGNLAIVGRNRAVADLPKGVHLGGFMAWATWLFVHIFYLIGFRSKLVVLSNWIYRFFTYQRGTRLIIRPFVRKEDIKQQEFLVKNEMV